MKPLAGELCAIHRELVGIVAVVDRGGWIEAGCLGHPTLLADAKLIKIAADGLVTPTGAGRRMARVQLRKVTP